jgi:hypothetical protein
LFILEKTVSAYNATNFTQFLPGRENEQESHPSEQLPEKNIILRGCYPDSNVHRVFHVHIFPPKIFLFEHLDLKDTGQYGIIPYEDNIR